MSNTSLDFILQDIRDYFASCAGNAQNGSAAFNRFNLYVDAISAVIEDRKGKTAATACPSAGGLCLKPGLQGRLCE